MADNVSTEPSAEDMERARELLGEYPWSDGPFKRESIARALATARAEENGACARIADSRTGPKVTCRDDVAHAIRARAAPSSTVPAPVVEAMAPANSECAHCGGPATCFGSYCNDYGCRERAYCDGCCNHSEARIGFCAHGVDRKCSLAPSPAPAAEPVREQDGACEGRPPEFPLHGHVAFLRSMLRLGVKLDAEDDAMVDAALAKDAATVAELRAEVARLTEKMQRKDELMRAVQRSASTDAQAAGAQRAEVRRKDAALRKFGQHKSGCYSERNFERDCDCGFLAALAPSESATDAAKEKA